MPRRRADHSDRKPERILIEAAVLIAGVSARTLQELAARGEIPGAAKIGRRWTFNERALRTWISEKEVRPRPDKRRSGALRQGWHPTSGMPDDQLTQTYRGVLKRRHGKPHSDDRAYEAMLLGLRGKESRST
jgi:excisionase family DNA binding protein